MDQINTVQAAIARIRAFAAARQWSRSRLANEAGMSDTVLRHFEDAGWNPTVDTLRKLEAVIDPPGWQPDDPVPPDAPDHPPRPRVVPRVAVTPVEGEVAATATQLTTEGSQAADEARADLAQRRRA